MPHDSIGRPLEAGDRVILTGHISEITGTNENFCNAIFVTDRTMTPEHDDDPTKKHSITISTRMATLVERPRLLNPESPEYLGTITTAEINGLAGELAILKMHQVNPTTGGKRERAIAITKVQEAIQWLKELREGFECTVNDPVPETVPAAPVQ